ncbi:MAG: ABC transporter permease, partial [Denitrovibrio sp.]
MFKTKKSGRGNSPGYKAVIFPALIAAIVFVPIVYIFSSFLLVDKYVFTHIASSILPEVAKNTIILALGTGILSVILGTTLAWLTAIYDFPFKKYFVWLLVLPIALPTYVLAFVGVGFFDYSGLFQDFLRLFGMKGFWFDGVRSAPGAIVVLSLSLYPYVYYITRSAFISQGPKALEVSELYGYSKLRTFVTVIIPMSRSYIAAGALLVIMESLADFGAVSVLNYNTLTTAIYQAWFAMFSFQTGLQISSFTLLIAVIILLTEQYTRSKMRFSQVGTATIAHKYIKLSGIKAWAAFGYC